MLQSTCQVGKGSISFSRASSSDYRRSAYLTQDPEALSVGDVLIYSSWVPQTSKLDFSTPCPLENDALARVLKKRNIKILAAEVIQNRFNIQAEQHCTSRVYDYILPVRYLESIFPCDDISYDTVDHLDNPFDTKLRACLRALSSPKLPEKGGFRYRKSEEQTTSRDSQRWHNYCSQRSLAPTHSSAQRAVDTFNLLGGLYQKYTWKKKSSQAATGVNNNNNYCNNTVSDYEDKFMTFRVSGDGFLTGQIRSMIGVLVCVLHGWLPESFIEFSQRSDVIIEVPLAPPGLLFLSEARYDWHSNKVHIFRHKLRPGFNRNVYKRIHNAQLDPTNFNSSTTTTTTPAAAESIVSCDMEEDVESVVASYYYNQSMVDDMSLQVVDAITNSAATQRDYVENWLTEMQSIVCPRILQRMDEITQSWNATRLSIRHDELFHYPTTNDGSNSSNNHADLQALQNCPPAFRNVLRLLMQADRSGMWPSTSPARQRVINSDGAKSSSSSNATEDSSVVVGGSFSVGRPVQTSNTPRGNALFADLVEAVFALEAEILPHRPASRMVAVNRRASFLPHKDSGAGFGQSTSLIVGLGDYVGGELNIEGTVTDIRYTPVEFDGWNQMHWTLPFAGNRYSLVWFTPSEKE